METLSLGERDKLIHWQWVYVEQPQLSQGYRQVCLGMSTCKGGRTQSQSDVFEMVHRIEIFFLSQN